MHGSDMKSIKTFFNPNFHEKIMKKYQTGKRNILNFPGMIFFKERGHFTPQKISLILKSRLRSNKQTILSSLLEKYVTEPNKILKPLFLDISADFYQQVTHITYSNAEMVNPPLLSYKENIKIPKLKLFGRKINNRSLNIGRHSTFTDEENKPRYQYILEHKSPAIYLNKQKVTSSVIAKNIPNISGMFEQISVDRTSHDRVVAGPQILNYGNNMNIFSPLLFGQRINDISLKVARNSTFINEGNALKNRSLFEHKSPVILLQNNLPFNAIHGINRLLFNELNRKTVNKPFNNYYGSSKQVAPGSAQNSYAYKAGTKSLHFKEPRRLEQEIEQIREIVLETKRSVSEKMTSSLGEEDIKRHIDVNRISDQVYQNIERTIRMERERRGI